MTVSFEENEVSCFLSMGCANALHRLHAVLHSVMLPQMTVQDLKTEPRSLNDQIASHVGSVLSSPAFISSKRCQQLLTHIVNETIEGRSVEITERTIAYAVFGKGQKFEPSEDSLVRVKAHEVRRRLADFYRDNPDAEVRVELPLGGYVPVFRSRVPSEPTPEVKDLPVAPLTISHLMTRRTTLRWIGGAVVAAAAIPAATYMLNKRASTPIERLWKPVADAKAPLIISIPVLTTQTPNGLIRDRVGLGVAAAISLGANFLNAHSLAYRLRFGSALTFEQLKEQPSLLLGGFTSVWGMWATKGLRFKLVSGEKWADSYIEDSQSGRRYQAENLQPDGYATADYAVVSRLFHPASGQIMFVAAGITTFGTEGAASVLFDPRTFANVVQNAPTNWESKNFEAIVKVAILGTTPSLPEVTVEHFW
jgi:hypothetical protein